MVEDHTSLDIGHQNNPSWDQYFLFFWKNIKRIWTLDIRIFVSLLAPEVLLDYQWPNLTIHPIHQSHPIRHIALNEINRPKIDLSRPPMTSNDWLLSANMLARKEDINALFDNIVQSLQLEERKFSELVSNGAHFSPSLYHMLKAAIARYHIGIIDPKGRHSLMNAPLIPEEAIHLNVSTVSNADCKLALVSITVY